MIFQAIEVSRRGGRDRYPAYNIYAGEKHIGLAICRYDDTWFVPWSQLDQCIGKRHFDSIKDAARHLYVAKEKHPKEHRAWMLKLQRFDFR